MEKKVNMSKPKLVAELVMVTLAKLGDEEARRPLESKNINYRKIPLRDATFYVMVYHKLAAVGNPG